jgi:Tryptophan halogenase
MSAFHWREVVLRLFPDAFVLAVSPVGQDVAEEIGDGLAACQCQAVGGDDRVAGGVVAGDANGHSKEIRSGFSSGVHLATYSALLAARSINSLFAGVVDEEAAFQEFEQRYRREYGVYHEFHVAFYDMHVSENSYFWSAKKVTKNTSIVRQAMHEGTQVQARALLGENAQGEDPLFEKGLVPSPDGFFWSAR